MTSGVNPWTRHLGLCGSWLKILSDELELRGHELRATEAKALTIDAAKIRDRAEALVGSLKEIMASRRFPLRHTKKVGCAS